MSTKRQPSKQRRQTQNQRQRAAMQARRTNAAGGPAPEGKVGGGGSTSTGSGASASGIGSLFSRLRGSTATGGTVRTSTPAGSQPVGYRAVLSGLLAGVAGVIVGAFLIQVPVDASGDPIISNGALVGEWTLSAYRVIDSDNPDALADPTAEEIVEAVDDWMPNGTEPYGQAAFPRSLFILLPVLGAGLAFRAVTKRASAKVVNRAMYVTMFGTLLSGQLMIFLPTVIGVGIAAFQVRKAEIAQAAAEAGDTDAEPLDEDGVIEVDEVDEIEDDIEDDELAEDDSYLEAEDSAASAPPASGLARLRRGRPGSS